MEDNDHLIAEHDPVDNTGKDQKKKWFWLGCLEIVPVIAGMTASSFHHLLFEYDYLVAGIMISVFIIYKAKDKIPAPIGLHRS